MRRSQCIGLRGTYLVGTSTNNKLTFAQAQAIRGAVKEGVRHKELALTYNVAASTISAVVTGRTHNYPVRKREYLTEH